MFTPPVPQNLPQRIQCHLLRGRSLRKLEMMTEALMDFNEACKLDPKDKSIGTNSNYFLALAVYESYFTAMMKVLIFQISFEFFAEAEADKIRAYIESNGDGWEEKWETDLLA